MGSPYAGRHRDAPGTFEVSASQVSGPRHARHVPASRRVPAKVVRRPLLSAGAALALVGACAAGYAAAGDSTSRSPAASTGLQAALPQAALSEAALSQGQLSQAPLSQAAERSTEQLEQRSYHQQAITVLAVRQSAAADVARAQQAAEAVRIQAEREAAQAQASRDDERQAVVAIAQQDPRSVARAMLADFGWGNVQWSCLERLWVGESGWDYRAENRSSGAYGIPQALPASKMGTVASDYLSNPFTQITWGMQYIKASYGTPCGALSFWNAKSPHWY